MWLPDETLTKLPNESDRKENPPRILGKHG